jgi:hypothetical protein
MRRGSFVAATGPVFWTTLRGVFMEPTRIIAILLLAFVFGGSSAEVAVHAKRVLDRHWAAQEEGSAGELVAFEIHRDDGEVLARPRVVAAPGRAAQLVLRDPEDPGKVRLALRVETTRQASGDLAVDYELSMPGEDLVSRGRVSITPGVEQRLELGDQLTATLLTIPVPSAAFDAYLESERAARTVMKSI